MPVLLLQIALIVIIVRSVYVLVQIHLPKKKWLEVLFHASVAYAALHFLF